MEKLLISVFLFGTCWAAPQDLSGKVFVFPKETDRAHVKLLTTKTNIESATVCLRFLTDLTRSYGLFSLATVAQSNGFLLFKPGDVETIELAVSGTSIYFRSLSFPQNNWHNICATWSSNGIAQVWVDGKPSVKRYVDNVSLVGPPITILGQEQDSYGGDFDQKQSFIGMISDVHMWNHVVQASDIKRYAAGKSFTPGNVFNWKALDFEIEGMILVEDETEVM
ncbi:serum amyloid P-component-like [Salarias fasciatus]|uniref:serum amyloid P-component-like n=1 Tax=Salarias fasciatus TaxID=181472 RepID=UPI001176ECCA|nr:serum amyloid P-component-like [Salarias fasciatus]